MATAGATLSVVKPQDNVAFVRIPPLVQDRWRLVRDVVYGDQMMRAGNYLPFLNSQDQGAANLARNAAYVQRAVWFPATAFTLEGFLGLAFRNDPTNAIEETKLAPMLTNVDGAGVSCYQQSQQTLANVLAVGRHGLLVDWSASLKQPVIKAYKAESIINWRYTIIDAQIKLSMVILEEEVDTPAGNYAMSKVRQWREVYLENNVCKVRVWRQKIGVANSDTSEMVVYPIIGSDGSLSDEVVLRSSGGTFDFIPFTFIGSQNNDGDIDASPFYGLATINAAHFRNSADYEDSVFWCGQTQAYITGLSPEWRDWLQFPTVPNPETGNPMIGPPIYIGSRNPLLLPENATFGYAQAEPNQLVKEAMDQKEAQMIMVGARMIQATPGRQRTATEDENDREATTSVLSMCVANVNEAYQRAFWFASQFMDMGKTWDASEAYEISQDFTAVAADATLLAGIVKTWQSGLIAMEDVRAYLRRVGLVPVERTDEEIDASIENDGPIMGVLGVNAVDASGNPIVAPPPPVAKSGGTGGTSKAKK